MLQTVVCCISGNVGQVYVHYKLVQCDYATKHRREYLKLMLCLCQTVECLHMGSLSENHSLVAKITRRCRLSMSMPDTNARVDN